ncbi:MAG: hypothetical protein OQL06_00530 [Gammaproteobacteria bacterium]|nr:hypothetical protein [Gammaproteobacteria bacterium]
MNKQTSSYIDTAYYTGTERRHASKPRRGEQERRHRLRTESLVSDCREYAPRRKEDEEGFVEISNLYPADSKS